MSDLFWRIFDGQEPDGSYTFATKNVALSSTQVERTYENGRWTLTQRDETGVWVASSRDHCGAVLLLLAARMGLRLPEGVDFEDEE